MLNIFLPAHAPDVAYASASKGVNNRACHVIFNVVSEYQFPSRSLSWELFAMMLARTLIEELPRGAVGALSNAQSRHGTFFLLEAFRNKVTIILI